jgi:hypothetical protein
MPTKEEIYDGQVAPLMTRIIEICQAHKIKMHASYELDGGMMCTTNLHHGEPSPVPLRLMLYASKAGNNIDAFMGAVKRDAAEYGHTSIALELLGVPPSPPPA